jgi:hypothetical protein
MHRFQYQIAQARREEVLREAAERRRGWGRSVEPADRGSEVCRVAGAPAPWSRPVAPGQPVLRPVRGVDHPATLRRRFPSALRGGAVTRDRAVLCVARERRRRHVRDVRHVRPLRPVRPVRHVRHLRHVRHVNGAISSIPGRFSRSCRIPPREQARSCRSGAARLQCWNLPPSGGTGWRGLAVGAAGVSRARNEPIADRAPTVEH